MIDPQLRDEGPAIGDRLLRQFAGLWLAFFGGLAIYNGVWAGRTTAAAVMGTIAILFGFAGLVKPGSIAWLFRLAMAIATPIGLVISTLLLAIIFYVVITPIALLFRVFGRDALARRLESGRQSHWVEREPVTDPRQYWHQS